MEISFIHMKMNHNLRVNKTNFYMKGFALGLALKQRRNATRKSPIYASFFFTTFLLCARTHVRTKAHTHERTLRDAETRVHTQQTQPSTRTWSSLPAWDCVCSREMFKGNFLFFYPFYMFTM